MNFGSVSIDKVADLHFDHLRGVETRSSATGVQNLGSEHGVNVFRAAVQCAN